MQNCFFIFQRPFTRDGRATGFWILMPSTGERKWQGRRWGGGGKAENEKKRGIKKKKEGGRKVTSKQNSNWSPFSLVYDFHKNNKFPLVKRKQKENSKSF